MNSLVTGDSFAEVMRGRHSEILSQMNYKLEAPESNEKGKDPLLAYIESSVPTSRH